MPTAPKATASTSTAGQSCSPGCDAPHATLPERPPCRRPPSLLVQQGPAGSQCTPACPAAAQDCRHHAALVHPAQWLGGGADGRGPSSHDRGHLPLQPLRPPGRKVRQRICWRPRAAPRAGGGHLLLRGWRCLQSRATTFCSAPSNGARRPQLAPCRFYDGALAHLMIFNEPLSPSQVAGMYAQYMSDTGAPGSKNSSAGEAAEPAAVAVLSLLPPLFAAVAAALPRLCSRSPAYPLCVWILSPFFQRGSPACLATSMGLLSTLETPARAQTADSAAERLRGS